MKRIMIGAASSGPGKTMITHGLLRALMKRGLHVRFYQNPGLLYHFSEKGRANR
ncbi:MAG: hypothetical protein ACI35R_15535 [Bacillus sp. (in: firmicutes)]